MSKVFKFTPLNFNWVAINPQPKGVVYFIGGVFWGSFPNIFYRYFLKNLFEAGYTIVAIPFRFTFDHWTVSIEIAEGLFDLRKSIYDEAKFRGYTENIEIYNEAPTSKNFNYLWIGHSLGCKYIALLEILTLNQDDSYKNTKKEQLVKLKDILTKCISQNQSKKICISQNQSKKIIALLSYDYIQLHNISLLNQPSLFVAPVISGIESAIPFGLASFFKKLGIDVNPTVQDTQCLITNSSMFNLFDIISFAKDIRAKETIQWFVKTFPRRIKFLLPNRNHLDPLGFSTGDEDLVKSTLTSIEDFQQFLDK